MREQLVLSENLLADVAAARAVGKSALSLSALVLTASRKLEHR